MKRAYFITDDLDEVEKVEQELEEQGIPEGQMKVLSDDETAVEAHHLHPVPVFFRKDIIHQGIRGAIVGTLLAATVVALGSQSSIAQITGVTPVLMLAAFIFGFSIWMGGFIGIQQTNYKFKDLTRVLAAGRHVFLVDYNKSQGKALRKMTARHPLLCPAGIGSTSINPFEDRERHPIK